MENKLLFCQNCDKKMWKISKQTKNHISELKIHGKVLIKDRLIEDKEYIANELNNSSINNIRLYMKEQCK